MKKTEYNKWNVGLWIANDEGLYNLAIDVLRETTTKDEAAEVMLDLLAEHGITHTPDGARYTKTSIRHALIGLT